MDNGHGLDKRAHGDEALTDSGRGSKVKWYAIGGSLLLLVVLVLLSWGLYRLGGPQQAALERLRDIAVIYVVLLFLITVVLLGGIAAALAYLILQVKEQVIPLLDEAISTMKVVRSTTEFMSEEAVRPVIGAAGTVARIRATANTLRGKSPRG